jgi:hypothetical protein
MQTRSRRRSVSIDDLAEAVGRLAERGPFRRGDIVRWRARSADEPLPRPGEPAVVVRQTQDGLVLMIAVGADGVGVPVWTEAWRPELLPAQQRGETVH